MEYFQTFDIYTNVVTWYAQSEFPLPSVVALIFSGVIDACFNFQLFNKHDADSQADRMIARGIFADASGVINQFRKIRCNTDIPILLL